MRGQTRRAAYDRPPLGDVSELFFDLRKQAPIANRQTCLRISPEDATCHDAFEHEACRGETCCGGCKTAIKEASRRFIDREALRRFMVLPRTEQLELMPGILPALEYRSSRQRFLDETCPPLDETPIAPAEPLSSPPAAALALSKSHVTVAAGVKPAAATCKVQELLERELAVILAGWANGRSLTLLVIGVWFSQLQWKRRFLLNTMRINLRWKVWGVCPTAWPFISVHVPSLRSRQ